MVNKKFVVLALILSLMAAGSLYKYLTGLEQELSQIEYRQVLVLKENVPAKTKVNSSQLETRQVPVDYVHPEAVLDPDQIIGSISRQDLVAGEQLLRSRLVEPGSTKAGLAFAVPQGKRAVTIPVNEVSALGYLLHPGDKVDVIVTLDLEDSKDNNKKIVQTKTILQELSVLAVGRLLEAGKTEEVGELKTVTLATSPEEAQPLVLASERGSIRLVLRSPVEEGKEKLSAWRLEDFLEER
ncbi:MAG TPA: Flp pilus assembly protein CpaB [Clostridia bacterium]|nr:Flp pilus assembly protein CpaB [Clostridia bacterium]